MHAQSGARSIGVDQQRWRPCAAAHTAAGGARQQRNTRNLRLRRLRKGGDTALGDSILISAVRTDNPRAMWARLVFRRGLQLSP